MDENTRNYILAILLSLAVLVGWQLYFAPTPEERQQAQQQTEQSGSPQQTREDGDAAPRPDDTAASDAAPQPDAEPSAPGSAPTPPGASREAALTQSQRINIDTPSLRGSLALKGARIDDLVLKKYRVNVEEDSANVTLFSPSGSPHAYYAEHGWVTGGGANVEVPTADTVWTAQSEGPLKPGSPAVLTWDNGEGLIFKRTITVDENYLFTVHQEVENETGSPVTLYPYALVSRHGEPEDVEGFYILHEGLIGVAGEDGLQEYDYDDVAEDGPVSFADTQGGWFGITDKYWAAVVLPNQQTRYRGSFSATPQNERNRYQADYLLDPVTAQAGGTASVEGLLFAGAKETRLIDSYAASKGIEKFDLLIDWGWFYFLTKPLFFALDYFFRLVGNFGLSILIVTVFIKLVLFPLANKSYASMSKMKKLQPEMQRIKERYAEDKTRQQQALMELYKNEKVNPASGCLPILIQFPVFFALYKVLFVTIEMRHAPFYGWIRDLSAPDPTSIFNLFGLIPWDTPGFLTIGVWPLIMGFTMFIQMRLNPAPPDPIQAKVFAWMPLFFTFLLATFPAGLVIYWAWNNILSVLQQAYIMHRHGAEIALFDNIGLNRLLGRNKEEKEDKKDAQAKGKG